MKPRRGKPANKHQVYPGRQVAQNEPGRIIPLTAQAQQILVQAVRQIEFAAVRVVARLTIGNLKELRGRPSFASCASRYQFAGAFRSS